MCCSMVDKIWSVLCKNRIKPVQITHRGYKHNKVKLREVMSKLELYVVGIILVYIYYDELFWLMSCYLPAKLASYGAASACHKNRLVFHIAHNQVKLNIYRLSSKQILHAYISKQSRRYMALHNLSYTRSDF